VIAATSETMASTTETDVALTMRGAREAKEAEGLLLAGENNVLQNRISES